MNHSKALDWNKNGNNPRKQIKSETRSDDLVAADRNNVNSTTTVLKSTVYWLFGNLFYNM